MAGRFLNFIECEDGRKLIMRLLARLHFALPIALLWAAVSLFLGRSIGLAYLRGLLFVLELSLSFLLARRTKTLWQYLLGTLVLSGLGWLLLGSPVGAVLAALLCLFRGRARLAESWNPILDRPGWGMFLIFLVVFVLSAMVGLPPVQRLCLLSAGVYLLLLLAFLGIGRLDRYLALNRGISGLPEGRIKRTAGAALGIAVLAAALLLMPAVLRQRGDFVIHIPDSPLREYQADIDALYVENYAPPDQDGAGMFTELDEEGAQPWQIPEFVSYLMYAVSLGAAALVIGSALFRLFREFRSSFVEKGDVVQYLTQEKKDPGEEELPGERLTRPRFFDRSPNARIRRRYRKLLLRAGASPQRWQSPAEIEASVGLENPTLHAVYEKARYGGEECTEEDVKLVRSEK